MQQQRYTLLQSAAILGISLTTLWRWRNAAGILPRVDNFERKIHYLSADQVADLARLHHRVVKTPDQRIAVLEQRVANLEKTVSVLLQNRPKRDASYNDFPKF